MKETIKKFTLEGKKIMGDEWSKKTTTILFKNIPYNLYRTFKAACAAKGVSMKEAFIYFMIYFSELY